MQAGICPLRLNPGDGPVTILVSDGVGGASAGEVASQMAVSLVAEGIRLTAPSYATAKSARLALVRAMRDAHMAILAKGDEPGFDAMGATLSAAVFTSDGLICWAQAGDSRIYLMRGGKLSQISLDHSPVGRLRQQGRISEADARCHPARNQIDLSLGDRLNAFEPDTGLEAVREGDIFMLCSDGLSDGLWDHEIGQILAMVRSPSDVRRGVQRLVDSAKLASGRDNITAVIALAAPEKKPRKLWDQLFTGGT